MATLYPANLINRQDLGCLYEGTVANVLVFDVDFNVDAVYYANNYDKVEKKISVFDNIDDALTVFKTGARVAKGTTGEKGFVTSFFANPFGPVQLEEETTKLLNTYFQYLFDHNIEVGQIYTGLALENAAQNPVFAATELFE